MTLTNELINLDITYTNNYSYVELFPFVEIVYIRFKPN